MFSSDEEIDLFEGNAPTCYNEEDLIEENWGQSWDANELDDVGNNDNSPEFESDIEKPSTHLQNEKELIKENSDVVAKGPTGTPVERMSLNDHKAGMEGLDKDKINAIIHKASKGSKYYENEKQKELKTKKRIEELKNELTKYTTVDKKRALHESDQILKVLRQSIDLTRTLVHIDMDAFYAAVEMRDNPELKDVPMAVGGNSMLSTSNYAARRYGVRAAMPGFIAKKLCPHLIIVSSHFDKYRTVSKDIREIFKDYDPNFSPMSLDEAYLDLTEYMEENFYKYDTAKGAKESSCEFNLQSNPSRNDEQEVDVHTKMFSKDLIEVIVEEIRLKIFEKTQLTASAGIAPNMMLSKICSDMNKPNGQYYLKPDVDIINEFVSKLPIRKVFGIGKVSEQMLKSLDIVICKDLYEKRDMLYLLFADTSFQYFMRVALGISSNRITHDDRKSMSAERTFSDADDKETLLKICYELCEHLASDLAKEDLQGRNVTLKYKLSSFVTKTRSKTLSYPISKTDEIYRFAKEILLHEIKSYQSEKFELRLMGVRICHFIEKNSGKQNTVESFFKALPGPSHLPQEDFSHKNDTEEFHSKNDVQSSVTETKKETVEEFVNCPVCGTALKNDLLTLNSHIDGCLTKQTIKEIVKEENSNANKKEITPSPKKAYSFEKGKSRKRKSEDNRGNCDKKTTLFSFWKK